MRWLCWLGIHKWTPWELWNPGGLYWHWHHTCVRCGVGARFNA